MHRIQVKRKKCLDQRIGPLLDHRVGPCPMFQSVAADLFGPIQYQGTVNKRQTGIGWGVMFVCMATSVIHM